MSSTPSVLVTALIQQQQQQQQQQPPCPLRAFSDVTREQSYRGPNPQAHWLIPTDQDQGQRRWKSVQSIDPAEWGAEVVVLECLQGEMVVFKRSDLPLSRIPLLDDLTQMCTEPTGATLLPLQDLSVGAAAARTCVEYAWHASRGPVPAPLLEALELPELVAVAQAAEPLLMNDLMVAACTGIGARLVDGSGQALPETLLEQYFRILAIHALVVATTPGAGQRLQTLSAAMAERMRSPEFIRRVDHYVLDYVADRPWHTISVRGGSRSVSGTYGAEAPAPDLDLLRAQVQCAVRILVRNLSGLSPTEVLWLHSLVYALCTTVAQPAQSEAVAECARQAFDALAQGLVPTTPPESDADVSAIRSRHRVLAKRLCACFQYLDRYYLRNQSRMPLAKQAHEALERCLHSRSTADRIPKRPRTAPTERQPQPIWVVFPRDREEHPGQALQRYFVPWSVYRHLKNIASVVGPGTDPTAAPEVIYLWPVSSKGFRYVMEYYEYHAGHGRAEPLE